jgi:hypothetical protein
LEPGYAAAPGAVLGATEATLCPLNTYRVDETPYNSTAGIACTPCAPNMVTEATGATSPDLCLTAPGYAWNAATGGGDICPVGTYSPGWNREGCVSCGNGSITTDGPGTVDQDHCVIPAGHFTTRSDDGETLTGAPCPVGTWGRDAPTYGLVDIECAKCPEFSTTVAAASNSSLQCLSLPGYGWYEAQLLECDYGTYSPGGTRNPCLQCGDGFNTSAIGNLSEAVTGATEQSQCVIAAGWTPDGASSIKPCVGGYYKAGLGSAACTKCPASTTSTLITAAKELTDCDSCRPGFGNYTLGPDGAPSCSVCPTGAFSLGFTHLGGMCQPCPRPLGFTGLMVSRRVSGRGGKKGGGQGDGLSSGQTYELRNPFSLAYRTTFPTSAKTGQQQPGCLLPRVFLRRC